MLYLFPVRFDQTRNYREFCTNVPWFFLEYFSIKQCGKTWFVLNIQIIQLSENHWRTNRRNRSLLYCFFKDLYHEKQYISSVAVQSYRDDCNVDLEKFYHHYKAEKLRAMSEYCPNSTRHICLFGKLF